VEKVSKRKRDHPTDGGKEPEKGPEAEKRDHSELVRVWRFKLEGINRLPKIFRT